MLNQANNKDPKKESRPIKDQTGWTTTTTTTSNKLKINGSRKKKPDKQTVEENGWVGWREIIE